MRRLLHRRPQVMIQAVAVMCLLCAAFMALAAKPAAGAASSPHRAASAAAASAPAGGKARQVAITVTVTVVGAGKPIRQADVLARSNARGATDMHQFTNAGGEAAFAVPSAASSLKVRVIAAGWQTVQPSFALDRAAAGIRIELAPLAPVKSAP